MSVQIPAPVASANTAKLGGLGGSGDAGSGISDGNDRGGDGDRSGDGDCGRNESGGFRGECTGQLGIRCGESGIEGLSDCSARCGGDGSGGCNGGAGGAAIGGPSDVKSQLSAIFLLSQTHGRVASSPVKSCSDDSVTHADSVLSVECVLSTTISVRSLPASPLM